MLIAIQRVLFVKEAANLLLKEQKIRSFHQTERRNKNLQNK